MSNPSDATAEPLIFRDHPNDWRDLQSKVARILREAGCKVELEYDVETVRGTVNIDVWARDPQLSPPLLYFSECKHWQRPVPKTVVHAFRTVVQDSGAHVGYIISCSGFQEGAFAAAENSNVLLVDWHEFQRLWIDRWKAGRYKSSEPVFTAIFEYFDYLGAPIGSSIAGNHDRLAEFEDLQNRYHEAARGNRWGNMLGSRFPPPLPHAAVGADGKTVTFYDYSSLFAWYELLAAEGLEAFRAFVKKYDPEYFASRSGKLEGDE